MDLDRLKWLLFSFKGRIGRKSLWLAGLASIPIGIMAVPSFYFITEAARTSSDSTLHPAVFRISGVYLVASLAVITLYYWITSALVAKRLHDRDRSGWWLVVPILGPVAVVEVSGSLHAFLALALFILAFGINFWLCVEIFFLKGTQGANRYGLDPIGDSPSHAGLYDGRRDYAAIPDGENKGGFR